MNNREAYFRFGIIFLVLLGGIANCATIFQDDFSGTFSKWTQIGGNINGDAHITSSLVGGAAVDSVPYMYVPYVTVAADFSSTINTFQVDWKWNLQGDLSLHAFMYVMNADMTEGYGVRFSGWNALWLAKYDKVDPVFRGGQALPSVLLGSTIGLAGTSYDMPFTNWRLTLDSSGNLSVYTSTPGSETLVLRQTVNDTSLNSFSKVVFTTGGIQDYFVDEVSVSATLGTCQDIIDGGNRIPGDFNGDCYVDIKDLNMFILQWLMCNNPLDLACDNPW